MSARELAEQHRQLLEDSGVSDEVARERGYWSATRKAELEALGFKRGQCSVPAPSNPDPRLGRQARQLPDPAGPAAHRLEYRQAGEV